MPDWSSYALSDVLPFSLETYGSLGALYNAAFTPAVVIGIGFGLSASIVLRDPTDRCLRLVLGGLGLSWLWISWAYLLQTLAPLLWAGPLLALAFALQSGLLLASAACPSAAAVSPGAKGRTGLGLSLGYGLLVFALVLLPVIELVGGQPWSGLSFFGSAPVPTAIGTLGVTAMAAPRFALMLIPIPTLWCLTAALLQLGLGDPLWFLPATAIPVAVAAALLRMRRARTTSSDPGRGAPCSANPRSKSHARSR